MRKFLFSMMILLGCQYQAQSPLSSTSMDAYTSSKTIKSGGSYSDYQNNSLLPLQIDDKDRHLRSDSSECCQPTINETSAGYTVTGIETWSSGNNPFNNTTEDVCVTGNINIKAGANLTITGMTFHFSETSSVIIEKTGKLTISNTVLTSKSCEGLMWQGVRVWGDPTLGPTTTIQGSFVMNNNSEINNAYLGVCNYNAGYNPSNVAQQTYLGDEGGRITTTNAFFKNNIRDVVIAAYNNKGGNYNFTNTVFETNAPILNGANPGAHVTLDDVDNINFKGCDFQNTTTGVYANADRGKGIVAEDANFFVNFQCSGIFTPCPIASRDFSSFKNLYQGINAVNAIHRAVNIRFCEFEDVIFGIYFENVNASSCVNNTFENIGHTNSLNEYGLFLNSSTGYIVENNNFNGVSTTNMLTTGILVSNSNDGGSTHDDNFIYNNHFDNVKNGILGIGQNVRIMGGNPVTNTGLQIWCNDFTDSDRHDIAWDLGGISPFQGNATNPSNNQFSTTIPSDGDYWNYNMQFSGGVYTYRVDYYHSMTTGGYNIIPQDWNGISGPHSNTNLVAASGTFSPSSSCPVNYFDRRIVRPRSQNNSIYETYQLDLITPNQKRSELDRIDDESSALLNAFNSGNLQHSEFEQQMMLLGGNLNDTTLIQVIDIAHFMPYQTVKDILLNNAPFSEKVASYINQSSLALNVKNQLINFSNSNGSRADRKTKEVEIAMLEILARRKADNEISSILSDSTYSENDKYLLVSDFYKKSESIEDKLKLIDLSLAFNQLKTVDKTIEDLRSLGDSRINQYCDFTALYMSAVETKDCLFNCEDSVLYNELNNYFLNNEGRLKSKAASMLRSFYGEHYEFEIPSHAFIKTKMPAYSASDDLNAVEKNLTIYPNPSTGIVNILFNENSIESGKITVVDQLGKIVVNTNFSGSLGYVDLSNFDKGIYQIIILTQDGERFTEKIVLK